MVVKFKSETIHYYVIMEKNEANRDHGVESVVKGGEREVVKENSKGRELLVGFVFLYSPFTASIQKALHKDPPLWGKVCFSMVQNVNESNSFLLVLLRFYNRKTKLKITSNQNAHHFYSTFSFVV